MPSNEVRAVMVLFPDPFGPPITVRVGTDSGGGTDLAHYFVIALIGGVGDETDLELAAVGHFLNIEPCFSIEERDTRTEIFLAGSLNRSFNGVVELFGEDVHTFLILLQQRDGKMRLTRIDRYTKVVLTVIAGLLGVIALRPYLGPEVVQAQGTFSGVQYVGGYVNFFDSRTGELWNYALPQKPARCRLIRLGQPFVCDKRIGGPFGPPLL